jgi:hypothetical protein
MLAGLTDHEAGLLTDLLRRCADALEEGQAVTFWMGVASAEHARGGRDGGFAQLGHGKHVAVRSLRKGDWIVYYSPREGIRDGQAVQAFVTIGRVTSEAPYRAEQAMNFHPYRVDVQYLKDAEPAPIKPLLSELRLTRDHGANWGMVMRGPKRRLDEIDMRKIAEAMGVLAEFEKLGG